jgi:hypothetical protein
MAMTMMFRCAALAAGLVALATPAAAADDGFAAFWPTFAAAVAKDDQAALARMVVLSDRLDQATPLSFARFHADDLGPAARRCLAKAKPKRDFGGNGETTYSAFCGEAIYGFSRSGGAWKLTDIGAND